MRIRAVLTSIFASVGVLIIGWQTGATAISSTQPSSMASGSSGTATTTTGTASSATSSTTTAAATADGTYTGNDVTTRFGSVQVEITVSAGQITDVTALQLTDADGRSRQISTRAEPILQSEVIAAQSSNVNNVSGATYTSNAYLQSLQSAIDQAGL